MTGIVLFDGVCNLCDQSVHFIIKRDPKGSFKFASQQSEAGTKLLQKHGLSQEINSFVLLEKDQCYLKSSAALRVCSKLNGLWKLAAIFLLVPPPLRNLVYDIIAKNRYKWFGKKDQCMLVSPELRTRFLD